MALPPRRDPLDPLAGPMPTGNRPMGAPTTEDAPDPTGLGDTATATMPGTGAEMPPQMDEPEEPVGGIFDAMDRVAANPPTPEEMSALIDETDRMHALVQDDPAPAIPLLEQPDEEIVQVFRGRLQEASAARAPVEIGWRKAFDDYNQKIDPSVAVWRSKVKIPYVRALVLSAIPSGIAAAFDSGTILRIKPQHPEWQKNAESMERLLQWQLTIKVPARKAFRHFLHYRALYGTGIFRTGWRKEKRAIRVRMPVYDNVGVDGQPLPEGQKGEFLGTSRKLKTVDVHDEPELEVVDLWNALPCPWTRLGKIPYFIERVEGDRETLMAMALSGALGEDAGEGKNGEPQTPVEAVEAWFEENPTFEITSGSTEFALGTRAQALQSIGLANPYSQAGSSGTEKDPGPNPCVWYLYSTQDVKICFSGDGNARILGKQGYPFDLSGLNYVISQFDEILPGYVWGAGIGMAAGPIQSQLDFDINHANDARRLALNPVLKQVRLGSTLMGDIAIRPGAIIPVREQSDLEQLELQDRASGNAIEWTNMLVGWGDRATGIGDLQRGLADQGVDTATEASIVDSNAITRKLGHVFEIRDVWQEIGRQLVAHNKQFFSQKQMIQVAGSDGLSWSWERLEPEQIIGEFDVVPGASMTRSDVVLQRRDWLTMYPLFNQDPLINQHELRRRFLTAMDQERIDDLLQPLPPPPQNPMDEEAVLMTGLGTPVSPDDDDVAHIQVHATALQALQAEPVPNTKAITAHEHHLQDHQESMATKSQMLMAGAQAVAGGGQPPGGGAPQAGKVRDKATMLGQAQGSDGQGGDAPGPKNATGRPVRSKP